MMESSTIIISIITSSALGAVVSYYFSKGKTEAEREKIRAESEGQSLENYEKIQAIIRKEVDPLKDKIEDLQRELYKLRPFTCAVENCVNRKNI